MGTNHEEHEEHTGKDIDCFSLRALRFFVLFVVIPGKDKPGAHFLANH